LHPTPEEGLAGAVLAAYGLESAAAGGDRCKLLVEGGRERFDAHCERVQAAARHGAATQGTDDVFTPRGADHRCPPGPPTRNCWCNSAMFNSTVPAASSMTSTGAWSTFNIRLTALSMPPRRISGSESRWASAARESLPPRSESALSSARIFSSGSATRAASCLCDA